MVVGNISFVDDAASAIGATFGHRSTVVDTNDGARQHIVGSYRNAGT